MTPHWGRCDDVDDVAFPGVVALPVAAVVVVVVVVAVAAVATVPAVAVVPAVVVVPAVLRMLDFVLMSLAITDDDGGLRPAAPAPALALVGVVRLDALPPARNDGGLSR